MHTASRVYSIVHDNRLMLCISAEMTNILTDERRLYLVLIYCCSPTLRNVSEFGGNKINSVHNYNYN